MPTLLRPSGGGGMIDLLEQQKKLTSNQWKLICTANIADLLDFFDFFLIGYVTAALTKEWQLPYWQGGAILLASGLGAVPGAFIWGWLGDKIGRRTVFLWSAITISLATGIMVFTPGPSALIPGWLFLVFFRVFVGIGNAGIFTIDLPLVQEFIPAYKRGWVSALVTTLLPGGGMLAGLVSSWLLPLIGWRYLFRVGRSGIVGRFFITGLFEPLGRRDAGTVACGMAPRLTVSAGYMFDVFIGGWSLYYMLLIAGTFFSSAIYTVVGPYMSEIWPARLRSSGMGVSCGVGNLGGKVLGPAGLAMIMGAGDIIKPAAPNLKMLGPAFVYFACWYILGIIGFWVFGPETKGRTFEEMDIAHDASARSPVSTPARVTS